MPTTLHHDINICMLRQKFNPVSTEHYGDIAIIYYLYTFYVLELLNLEVLMR